MKVCPNCKLANADQNPQCVGCNHRWTNVPPPIPQQAVDPQLKRNRHAFIAISIVVLLLFTTQLIKNREEKAKAPSEGFSITVNESDSPSSSEPSHPRWWRAEANGKTEDGTKYIWHGRLLYYVDSFNGREVFLRAMNGSDETLEMVTITFEGSDSQKYKVGTAFCYIGSLRPGQTY